MTEGKIKFDIFNSTFYKLVTTRVYDDITFESVFSEKFYTPIIKIIRQNTSANDIIYSNVIIADQIFASLSDRPSSVSMLREVQPKNNVIYQDYAKLIILLKPISGKDMLLLKGKKLNLIFENDIAYIFLNKDIAPKELVKAASFKFIYIYLIVLSILLLLFYDNIRIKKPKNA